MMRVFLTALLTLVVAFPAYSSGKVALVEILFLNKGHSEEQVDRFFAKAYEVGKRYGATPIAGMKLKRWLRGGSQGIATADFIVGTEFPSQDAMNKMLSKDRDYDSLLFERDTLFDSSKTITFAVESMAAPE